MSDLRGELARILARKVDAHGLVVWNDPAREYLEVASTLVPSDAEFAQFQGSWYALRRGIDEQVARDTPPRLVVYVPTAPPTEDPLSEVRAMSGELKIRLPTLVTRALTGQLTPARIEMIARTAATLVEAEAALSSDGGTDVRLITALGTADTTAMLVSLIVSGSEALDPALACPLAELCMDVVGVELRSAEPVSEQLFGALLLNDIALALGSAPPGNLATATPKANDRQRQQSRTVLQHVRLSPGGAEAYARLAAVADAQLHLEADLDWDDLLASLPGTTGTEHVAFREVVRLLCSNEWDRAGTIAASRSSASPWVAEPHSQWRPRWNVVRQLVKLHTSIAADPAPYGSAAEQLLWYADRGWRVDRAHRRLELARTELDSLGDLDELLIRARDAYDTWLDDLLRLFTSAVESSGLDVDALPRHGQVHDRYVGTADGRRVAYIWVDALRLELAHDLKDSLGALSARVHLDAAIAAAPTITQVGMAALLPGADVSLSVSVEGDHVEASISGHPVRTVADRVDVLRTSHRKVVDLDLNQAANRAEKELHRDVGDADLILVRSQELDSAGESGMLAAAWSTFEAVTTLLRTVISRLAAAGVERIVVCADHGFIALGQSLGPQRTLDPPAGAVGALKRRCFVGKGGLAAPATVRVPLSSCGVRSDCDITVPRGLAVFRAGGARQFFHGGLSPQELLVPVLVIDVESAPVADQTKIMAQIAGDRITTGVFAATIGMEATLFTSSLRVRATLVRDRIPVARLVSGDGVDQAADAVDLQADRPSIVTFQVTRNLGPADSVQLLVLDASTGRTLATVRARVAAAVIVEDDLG